MNINYSKIIVIAGLLFSCSVKADYLVYSEGKAVLNYDVKSAAYKSGVGAIEELGGTVNVNYEPFSKYRKIAYGHQIGDISIGIVKFDMHFSANANYSIDETSGKEVFYNIKGKGFYKASAKISGIGPRIETFYSNFFVGISAIKTKTVINTDYDMELASDYGVEYFNIKYKERLKKHKKGKEVEIKRLWVTMFNVGYLFGPIRFEYEKIGFERSIDIYSIGIQLDF